jgi:crossover junction endodeoxyribonuclease RuvC
MIVCGIDPGLKGAICFIENGKIVFLEDMPVIGKELNRNELYKILSLYPETTITGIEQQSVFQGQKAALKIGRNFGILEAFLFANNKGYEVVTPQKWKKYFNLLKKEKSDSVNLAIQLFPEQEFITKRGRLIDGRAEAALIALFMYEKFSK